MSSDQGVNRRFLMEVEQGIRLANNEIIHKVIPPVTSDRMLTFAVAVGQLRAQYISAAFKFADAKTTDGKKTTAEIDELSLCRRQFEEARDAYSALQRAIELGYVAIE
jgi:hypothetical protein